ncbi:TolC family protein [Chryseobacterium daecheongense]|uniref:TolC family protein n=1 Tax=Chryseobacterium daecheongense TaxID=192389 RepID=UPI001FD637A1|nr:TolC family protein [Chryseobacterium daecheongense]UOU99259.1 TolC family protein [Chryseobacterium daecheongense]
MFRNTPKYLLIFLFAFIFLSPVKAQSEKLTLEECYRLAKENYPLIKKIGIIAKTADFNIENANKRYLPQISFSGQATYQSQTINFSDALGSFPINPSLPTLSKDQYKIQGEIDQILYDGGTTKNQKDLIKANTELQVQNIEANLYTLKQRINAIYFSILLMDAQLKQNELNKESLQTQAQKTEAALKYGTAFRSSLDELKAEIINVEMMSTEYKANREAYLKMLSLFIGKSISGSAQLELPEGELLQTEIIRPELKGFDLQKSIYDLQKKQLKSDFLPKVSAFFQGAYGRPTLNIIENKFGPWFITGVRFSWSLESLYTTANKKEILELNRRATDIDKETFLLNTKLDLTQQDEQVKKYTELVEQDEKTIALRQSVKQSAEAQLSNGVITIHEYIQKTNAEHLAKQTLILHQIQLLQAKYNQKFIIGN